MLEVHVVAKTPLYSAFSSDPFDPRIIDEILIKRFRNEITRESYPCLPWSLEDLIGSIWCNVHTGALEYVERIELGPAWAGGALIPCFPMKNSVFGRFDGPGFWGWKQFLVEHWVRIDLWPLSWQLCWFSVALRFHRERIAWHGAMIEALGPKPTGNDLTRWTYNHKLHRGEQVEHQQKLQATLQEIHQFAKNHQIPIPRELVNEGIGSGKTPEQMSLF